MKILRVIPSMNPKAGGPCQGIRNSIPELEKIGVYNEVVCLDAPDAEYLGTDSFTIQAIGEAKGPWGYSKNLIPWLQTNSIRFNVIIIHGLWQFHSYAVYKIFKIKNKNVRYFVMPHGMLDPYFQKAPDRKFKALRNWIFWKLVESKVINNAHGILFTCEEELVLARQTFKPYKPRKELNVGYGIQEPPSQQDGMVAEFKSTSNKLSNRPYILFLSRIHPKKGIDLMVKAYKKYCTKNNNQPEFDLVIAGPGLDSAYGKEIVNYSETNNIQEYVHFPGMLTGNIKWGAFHGAEAFILPSHQENFGIAVVEALACNKPVLISNKVNIYSEIQASQAGFVENDDLKGTVNLFNSYAGLSGEERRIMSINARSCYLKYFAIKPAAENLLKAISA